MAFPAHFLAFRAVRCSGALGLILAGAVRTPGKKKKLLSNSFTACVVFNSIHKSSEAGRVRRAGALSARVCSEQKALDVVEPSAGRFRPFHTNPAIKKMALSHFRPISALQNANIA